MSIFTGNVVPLGNVSRLDLPVDRVLEQAKADLDGGGVVILGSDRNGGLHFASSYADGGEVLWLLEQAKKALLDTADGLTP